MTTLPESEREELESAAADAWNAIYGAIGHVGRSNGAGREREAVNTARKAFFDFWDIARASRHQHTGGAEPAGDLCEPVVTCDESGRAVCIAWQDAEGRIHDIIWEAPPEPAAQPAAEMLLFEHDDGRHMVAPAGHPILAGDVCWHRVGPVELHLHSEPPPEGPAVAALREIAAIENEMFGGDWDEIEEARSIARKALSGIHGSDPTGDTQ